MDETDITDDIVKQLSYVETKDVNGNPIDWSGITVDAAELIAINDNKNAGILPLPRRPEPLQLSS